MSIVFNKCIEDGGDVKTKQLPKNRYMRICVFGGKEFAGEIKRRKNPKRPARTGKTGKTK